MYITGVQSIMKKSQPFYEESYFKSSRIVKNIVVADEAL